MLREAQLLRGKEGYKIVYICPDRTVDERRAYKKLVAELKVKKIEEPDIKFFIMKNIKVVSVSKDSRSAKEAGSWSIWLHSSQSKFLFEFDIFVSGAM